MDINDIKKEFPDAIIKNEPIVEAVEDDKKCLMPFLKPLKIKDEPDLKIKPCYVRLEVMRPEEMARLENRSEINASSSTTSSADSSVQDQRRRNPKLSLKCLSYNCISYFKTEEERNVHMKKSHKHFVKCIYCNLLVCSISAHVLTKHKDITVIRCSHLLCASYFKTEKEKRVHVEEKHSFEKLRQKVSCPYCEKTPSGVVSLRAHVKCMHKEIAIKCNFLHCGQFFKTQSALQSHFEEKHAEAEKLKIFKCKLCSFKGGRKKYLRDHIARKHGSGNFQCPLCEKSFKCILSVDEHVGKVHKEKKICPHCKFPIRDLKSHLLSEFCPICKQKFYCAAALSKHSFECRLKKQFECNYCCTIFDVKCSLIYHIRSKHDPSTEGKWKGLKFKSRGIKCKKCKKYFSSKPALDSHNSYSHGSSTKLNCDLCKKQLNTVHIMRNHMYYFHGFKEKMFVCPKCPRSFSRNSYLKRHWTDTHDRQGSQVECKQCGKVVLASSYPYHHIPKCSHI